MKNPVGRSSAVELTSLISSFVADPTELGDFQLASATELPSTYRRLLAHNDHMTLAVEAYHECPVDVDVLQSRRDDDHYLREILLKRSRDSVVIQYGIVRLQLSAIETIVRDEILSEKIPLGRVLIKHNVLRSVELNDLWRISVGQRLASHFQLPIGSVIYGRTAMIHLDEQPALELLEIVTDKK